MLLDVVEGVRFLGGERDAVRVCLLPLLPLL